MITVTGFKETENKEGKTFNVLELEGEVELIKAVNSGKFYAHARKATITSTLNVAGSSQVQQRERKPHSNVGLFYFVLAFVLRLIALSRYKLQFIRSY